MKNLRTKFTAFLVGFAFVISGAALAETFNLFSPATGILKGNSRSYVTTAANASDVVALWSGTCSASTFLAGNGTCQPEAGGGTVTSISQGTGITATPNPIVSTGTIAINQAFNPTWTGQHVFAGPITRFIQPSGGEQARFGGATGAANPYVSFFKQDGTTRVGYLQAVETSNALQLNSDTGPIILRANNTPDLAIDGDGSWGLGASGDTGTAGQVLTSGGANAAPTWTTIAAGGTPGGSNTQFQYNNAGAFAGAAQLAWDSAQNDLLLGPATGVGAGATLRPPLNTTGTGTGSDISVWGGSSTTGTASGGAVDIRGGSGVENGGNSFGGDVRIYGGAGSFSDNVGGGSIEIFGGEGNMASGGGSVTIAGGAPSGTGLPGDVSITGGTASEQRGGDIDINAGDAGTQGTNNFRGGNIVINAGSAVGTGVGGTVTLSTAGTNRLVINNLGSWVLNTSTGTTGQVLTSQGASASPIWTTVGAGSPSGASATAGGTTSATNGSAVAVALSTEEFDTGNFHDTATNNSRVILPGSTGYASCSGSVSMFTGNTQANTYMDVRLALRKNGTLYIAQAVDNWYSVNAGSSIFVWLNVSNAMIPANGTDYVEMIVLQNGASGAGTITANSNNSAGITRLTCSAVK